MPEDFPDLGPRFRVLRQIGAGGMGVVYEAEESGRTGHIALKTLPSFDATGIYDLKQEFRGLADVVHPNLVRLFELVEHRGIWFFTMELVEGVTFLQHLRPEGGGALADTVLSRPRRIDIPLQPMGLVPKTRPQLNVDSDALREVTRQLSRGLLAVHRADKLHCDLKPSNVLVTESGRVVLLDFGLAMDLSRDADDRFKGSIVGTPVYMAPEQAFGPEVTSASDWYSVGIMLYEALVGRPPFDGSMGEILFAKQRVDPRPPSELVDGVPTDLERLALDLLARDAADRPTGEQVLDRLTGSSPPSRPYAISPPMASGTFIGRTRELGALDEAFAASESKPVSMLVLGQSGIGKSTLIERFLSELRNDDVTVLTGRCYERESVPYKAFDGLIDDLSRHLMRMSGVKVARLMPRDPRALAQVFPVLRRIEAMNEAGLRPLRIDEHAMRRNAFAGLKELLARLADRTRLVLWVDDLQWGDADSAHLLEALCSPPDPPAMLLVGSCRTEERETSLLLNTLARLRGNSAVPPWDAREIELSALDATEAERAAAELLDDVGRTHASRIARESAGNPFLIGQLVEWVRDGGGTNVTLSRVMLRRTAALPPEARDLLAVVAVAGRPIVPGLAFEAAGLSGDDDAPIATLRAARLVRTGGVRGSSSIETYHDRIREMVVSSLSETELARRHGQLAETLLRAGSDDANALATHLEGAGRVVEASGYWERAGDKASAALAFEEAARAYRRAVDAASSTPRPSPGLLRKLGEALASAARGREAVPVFERAASASTGDDALELRLRTAEQLLLCGRLREGLERLGAVLVDLGMPRLASPAGAILDYAVTEARLKLRGVHYEVRPEKDVPRRKLLAVDACRTAARVLSMTDPLRSGAFQSRQLLEALTAGEPSRLTGAVSFSAIYAAAMNRDALSKELVGAAEALAKDGDPAAAFHAALARSASMYVRGEFAACVSALDELAEQRPPGSDLVWSLHFAQLTALGSHLLVGSFGRVLELIRRIGADAKDRGDEYNYSNLMLHTAQWEGLGRDEPTEARAALVKAMREAPPEMGFVLEWGADQTMDLVDQYAGESERAFQRTPQKWAWRGRSYRHYRLQRWWRAFLAGGIAATCMRDRTLRHQARATAERYAHYLAADADPWARAMGAAVYAAVAWRDGNTAGAAGRIAEAVRGFEHLGVGMYAVAARRAQGLIVGGDQGQALVDAADAQLRSESVKNPARFAEAFVAGFAD